MERVKYFDMDYEEDSTSSGFKKYHYIHGGNGLTAIFVMEGSGNDTMYYVLSDHLGSLTTVVNASTSAVENYSFNAWGMPRDSDNWTDGFSGDLFAGRGFTGHEHLEEFNLINMNGRVYDPILGRFLSPDPYVQLPGYPNSFNRYSYALNNPLIYTDPSGEFPFLIVGLVLLGGYLGGVGSNDLELNPVHWDWSAPSTYFGIGIGAAAGALGGYGLVNPGTVTYTAGLLTPFGQVGLSGFQNDWNFQWTTVAGGSGEIPLNDQDPVFSPEYQVSKGISYMYRPGDPRFYPGTLNEAKDLLVATSKYHNTEMGMYYFKDYGYYLEESYGYLAKPFYAAEPSNDFWSYSHFDGYYKYYYGENGYGDCYPYSLNSYRLEVYVPNGLHPRQNIGRPNAYYHTHPNNSYLSTPDINNMERRGFPTWAVGWDGIIRGIRDVFHFLLPGVEIRR